MKKSYILSLIIALTTPFFFISKVEALDIHQLDQSQLESIGHISVYSDYNYNQTFKVIKNVLTGIEIQMINRKAGNSITLTVKDETTGKVIVTKTQRMGAGDGWEYFNLEGDGLGYTLVKPNVYSMTIGTAFYAENAPSWLYTDNANSYLRGSMRIGTIPFVGDFTFKTYGYTIDLERENTDLPVVEEEDTPTPVPAPADSSSEDKVIVTPDSSVSAFDIDEEDIDDSVVTPSLEFVIVNDLVVDPKVETGVIVDLESVIKVSGTAGAGDTVAVKIGEKIFTAKADEDGNWYVIISTVDLAEGTYVVTAQSKDEDAKGSSTVNMFNLTVSATGEAPAVAKDNDSKNDFLTYLIYGAGGLFVVGLIILIIFFVKKRKKNEKKDSVGEVMNSSDGNVS